MYKNCTKSVDAAVNANFFPPPVVLFANTVEKHSIVELRAVDVAENVFDTRCVVNGKITWLKSVQNLWDKSRKREAHT